MGLPRFLAELKHRNVYRVAVVYAAVGWALLEVSDVVLPRLALPDWTVNFVLAVVLLGFPLAIVFAWIFDLSPQGIVRTEPISPETHHRFSFVRIVEFLLIVALVVVVGGLYVDRLSLQRELVEAKSAVSGSLGTGQPGIPNPERYRAIAVLPFADMSEAGDQSWFAEGIAEELLHALADIEGLQVMARTSSFAFKGTDKTIAQIAEILGVQAVLEGSVRRFGDRVRVTAQLVDAISGYHIWSGSYERQLDDIFELQDELARAVVQALRIELGVDVARSLVAEHTANPEAYSWFIRGRALFDWVNPEVLRQSVSYFEKAVEVDPDYALAWGYLSFARMTMMLFLPFDEMGAATKTAYQKALELDPEQGQALAAKAMIILLLEHDWERAGRLYQQAVKSRDNSMAMAAYPLFYLSVVDRVDQAIRLYTEEEKRDPLHAGNKANFGAMLILQGYEKEGIAKCVEALKLNPRHLTAIAYLIWANVEIGNYPAVQRLMADVPTQLQEIPRIKAMAGLYHAATGNEEKARKMYRDLLDNPLPAGPFFVSVLSLGLGEVEDFLELTERQIEEKRWTQFWLRNHLFRTHEILKDDPRYLALLKRIGLDDESVAALHQKLSFD